MQRAGIVGLTAVLSFAAPCAVVVSAIPAAAQTTPSPAIRVLYPLAGTSVTTQPVLIHGTVDPPDPELRVTVNARPTLTLQGGQWATLRELAPGTHELLVEGRARGQVVSKIEHRVTVASPLPSQWPLLLWGGAPWAGMGMQRTVPVGIAPFVWVFKLASWSGVKEGQLDPEGNGRRVHVLRGDEGYTHHFTAPGIYAPRLRYTDQAGRILTQQALILVLDRVWLEPILQAQWREFLTAVAQSDLDKATGLIEVTRRERFRPWREVFPPELWPKWAAALSAHPLVLERLEGYLAICRLGTTPGRIEFAPDQGDGRWRYYFREGHMLGVLKD